MYVYQLKEMNLIIDQGNTNVKFYVFNKDKINKFFLFPRNELNYSLIKNLDVQNIIYSTVSDEDKNLINCFKNKKFIFFDYEKLKLPIVNKYKSASLGKDRLANAIAANYLYRSQNILIVDFGTAITYDFVNKKNEFIGGNISPGVRTRLKSLNLFTADLPLIEPQNTDFLLADNTNDAILGGVMNGILFEIQQYINILTSKYINLNIIFTGGDANLFAKKIKNTIFAEPNLVAIGLNILLNHNLNNN